uniref:Alanine--glyoxylate aminotransferase n=1 Tax=Plectus sambesii TaxID=2011161 RepID=A0A914XG97_9BILA
FTPGPLNTSKTVKEAMLSDVGSRDVSFINITANIRRSLLTIADADSTVFTAILLQGSGTYAIEAVFANALGRQNGKALIISNGAYGDRMAAICKQGAYNYRMIRVDETEPFDLVAIEKELREGGYTLVAAVHCETSTGQFNLIEELASLVSRASDAKFFVDAMSSFGAVPISLKDTRIDFLVSSANKCLQGVPGFAFVLAKISTLESYKGRCTSWSLDLVAQYEALEKSGQFRCTPPTHTMLAFQQALTEHAEEGGVAGRQRRYTENNRVISEGMRRLGFRTLLHDQSPYIITSFVYPKDDHFDFEDFYGRLSKCGQVIYPGKVSSADCFRLGNIGDLWPADCQKLVDHIKDALHDMGVHVPIVY